MINFKEDKRLNPLNHSCAHLLAQAVKHLYLDAKFWVGPVIEEGFYYDMDLGDKVLTEDDLPKIEKEMKKCAKDAKYIVGKELTKQEAIEMFKNDPYKIDLINKMNEEEQTITAYTQGDFTDLCRGGHVENTKELKNFKLLKVSGAYWKGDAKNKMLQRVYGVCFDTQEELLQHLEELEEAKQRDHRKIGKDLDIYMMSELVGKGLPIWLPNGYTVWRLLQNYITEKELYNDYLHVHTPDLGNVLLYKTSGHWEHYKDDMFPKMDLDNESFVLRPMNCPHHMVIFSHKMHSYKDLPIRIAEIANDFRFEASGAVKGIERTRAFTQNDSHIFCRKDQIEEEFKGVLDLILDVYKDLGFNKYKCRLSLRDPDDKNDKYFKDDNMWNLAEDALRNVLNDLDLEYFEAVGEAAFYGPKLDILVEPAIGNEIALSTIQLDFLLPKKFDLYYVDENNEKITPVVIHRAILGSLDRFIAFLLEETKGVLPTWLAPTQVRIIPVSNEHHLAYATDVYQRLKDMGLRVYLDSRDEKVGYKMRESITKKTPYQLVVGDKEVLENSVTYRLYGTNEQININLDEFTKVILEDIKNKKRLD